MHSVFDIPLYTVVVCVWHATNTKLITGPLFM